MASERATSSRLHLSVDDLQEQILRALERGRDLQRGERLLAWRRRAGPSSGTPRRGRGAPPPGRPGRPPAPTVNSRMRRRGVAPLQRQTCRDSPAPPHRTDRSPRCARRPTPPAPTSPSGMTSAASLRAASTSVWSSFSSASSSCDGPRRVVLLERDGRDQRVRALVPRRHRHERRRALERADGAVESPLFCSACASVICNVIALRIRLRQRLRSARRSAPCGGMVRRFKRPPQRAELLLELLDRSSPAAASIVTP